MDRSEYTKKFANDVARTGVGFETNFYSSGRSVLKCDEKKKIGGRVERKGKAITGVPDLARCSRTIGRKWE
jgi:hypothetical protein